MTEENQGTSSGEPSQEGAEGQDPKTFDAEYVSNLRKEAARYRTEAKANADAAKRLAEMEESQKSEIQKAQERAQQLEQELATERVARLRTEIASTKGVPASSLTGSTKEEMEAAADALLEWKGNTGGRGRPGGGFQSGASGSGSGLSGREKAAAALRQLSK